MIQTFTITEQTLLSNNELQITNKPLTIEYEVGDFNYTDAPTNPTGDDTAVWYSISIDGTGKRVQTFVPGESGYKPMFTNTVQEYIDADILQIKNTYKAV